MTVACRRLGQYRLNEESPMTRLLPLALAALAATVASTGHAAAAPAKKKYHFELLAVTAKSEVKPDVAKAAVPRVQAQVAKVFEKHPQLVAKLDGAPDPKAQADNYRRYLTQKGIAGAYLVSVEITEASE